MRSLRQSIKKIIFLTVVLLPLIFAFSFIFSVILNVKKIQKNDYDKIYTCLNDYLKKDKCEVGLAQKDGYFYLDYHYLLENGLYKPAGKGVGFKNDHPGKLVYFFGSSEFAFKPPFFKGDFPFVTKVLYDQLNSYLPKGAQLINFSMNALDTFDIEKIAKSAVALKKPDLLIYYDVGASDFEGAYFSCIKNNFKVISPFIKNLSRLIIFKSPPKMGKANQAADWFMRAYVDPNALRLLQWANIIKIPWEPFTAYNQLIMSYYKNNVMRIVQLAKEKDIPLIIVAGVSNLESPTFGIYSMSDAFYDKGMHQKDYSKRVLLLQQAKDTEIFTGELCTKSPIYEFLASLEVENVYVFDAYSKLKSDKVKLGYNLFYDYGHMRPELHKIIADYIFTYIKEKDILK